MIVKIEGKCQYEGCEEKATHIACGRGDGRGTDQHPRLGVFCEDHAYRVSEESFPEYIASCPNCGCLFGID